MNVGCVRKAELRSSAGGSASATVAKSASCPAPAAAPPNTRQIASTSLRVDVSSSDIPSVRASMMRKFIPFATPRSRIDRVAAPVATVSVSKKWTVGTAWPSRSRPAFRIAVSRWTRRAIVASPRGP